MPEQKSDGRSNRPSPRLGGVIHAYQKYDPQSFPSPRQPGPDVASAAFEHMLRFGSTRHLSDEELARAIKIDPSQIAGLGPSLESLIEMLEERKRKILETYEADSAVRAAQRELEDEAADVRPPEDLAKAYHKAIRSGQIRDLERLWYRAEREDPGFATQLLALRDALGSQYLVEELASKYHFTGRTGMDVETALRVKEELETIDRLLDQLREAMKNAQIAVIDMDELGRFVEEADVNQLRELNERVQEYIRQQAEMQGLDPGPDGYRLTPQAYRVFQAKLLDEIFGELEASRSGRHQGPVVGEGAVELPRTRPYEFGDSPAHMDVGQTVVNAVVRLGRKRTESERIENRRSETERSENRGDRRERSPTDLSFSALSFSSEDIEIHDTRNTPKCATVVCMDMSGSMRHGEQYVSTKRMALAFDGLIKSEYPGDFLEFVEVYSVARRRHASEIAGLMPKPVTIRDPVVRLKADLANPRVSEAILPPHFTNIQHGLRLARQLLEPQDTPNKQVIVLTDGLPTAHMDGSELFLLYPADPLTERATMREALACSKEGITINFFLLPNWWQDEDDIAFAHRMAEATGGRVFFTAGGDVDRFVLWDYVAQRRKIIG